MAQQKAFGALSNRKCIIYPIFTMKNYRYQERYDNLAPNEVRTTALGNENPIQYPIPNNKRIQTHKTMLDAKKQKQSA